MMAGDLLYFGSSTEHTINCFHAATGNRKWSYFTDGPMRMAPTVSEGRVYAGSDDGSVHCLEARDGILLWKQTPAGAENYLVPNDGKFVSPYAIRSSVAVEDSVAYFSAGFFPHEGVYLCAVDAVTGQQANSRHWKRKLLNQAALQGYILLSATRIYMPGNRSNPFFFNRTTGASKPFDCSAFKGVVMTFSAIYEQNQDSLGAVEYSVDGGQNWLPVVYFLESPDIVRNSDGTVDAVTTFKRANADTSSWVDGGVNKGDNYGDGIAAPITAALGDYIVPRINYGKVDGQRVEVFRLNQAAGKSDVRIRLAQLGTDSWYFAIDNLAFYDVAPTEPATPLRIVAEKEGANVKSTWEGPATLQSADVLTGPYNDVAGAASGIIVTPSASQKYWRLKQ
ncbi:MAG: PQQ-like beta-propeller repeat protein [Chloroflexi bacterium]|nr:PQQ-like beta-propeller repeat protein [Chloroflexota bacterium]